MSKDPQQSPSDYGEYPYGDQTQFTQNKQASTESSQPQNPYGASQYPYEEGEAQNPYGASQYPYEEGEAQNPYGASQYPYEEGEVQNPYGASQYPYEEGEAQVSSLSYAVPEANNQVGYSDDNSIQEDTSLPLGEAIRQLPQQYLRILTKPSPKAFTLEKGKASWDIVWVQLLGYAIIEAILGYLATLINPAQLPPSMSKTITSASYQAIIAGFSIASIFIVPLFFFIGVGILHLIAKAFKGEGSFLQYSYAILLFTLPLNILANLSQLIPIAGPAIFFLLLLLVGIYETVLSIFATMAVHRLSGGKASAVILIPLGIAMLLACAAFLLLIVAVIGAAGRIG